MTIEQNSNFLNELRMMGVEEYAKKAGALARRILEIGKAVAKDLEQMEAHVNCRVWAEKNYICKIEEVDEFYKSSSCTSDTITSARDFLKGRDCCCREDWGDYDPLSLEDSEDIFSDSIDYPHRLCIKGVHHYSRGIDYELLEFILSKIDQEEKGFLDIVRFKCTIQLEVDKCKRAKRDLSYLGVDAEVNISIF